MPKVTVVIPLYNKEMYIEQTLNSVLNQTFKDFEIIIIDDGSTDKSFYNAGNVKDPRIKIITQVNAGVSATRNRGIDESSTELIAFLDADDVWKPGFLETVLDLYIKYPDAGAFGTAMEIINPDGSTIIPEYEGIPPSPWQGLIPNYFQSVLGEHPINPSNVMIPKNVFNAVGKFAIGEPLGEDQEMWCRIALKYRIAFCNKVFSSYREGAINNSDLKYNIKNEPPALKVLNNAIKYDKIKITPVDLEYIKEYIASLRMVYAHRIMLSGDMKNARGILYGIKTHRFKKKRNQLIFNTFRDNLLIRSLLYLKHNLKIR